MTAIQEVTRYQFGGKDYKTLAEAERAQDIAGVIVDINGILATPVDEHCDFANGEGYVQHSEEGIKAYVIAVQAALCAFETPEIAGLFAENPRGFVQRVLDDCGSPFRSVVWRLARIDADGREWGQIFYANNPSKGKVRPWPNIKPGRVA